MRVLHSREEQQAARVRELEATMRDWLQVFSAPSEQLKQAGVTLASNAPSDVAKLVVQLAASVRAQEAEAGVARASFEREATDLRRAVRDAGRVSRDQAAHELTRIRTDAERAIETERKLRIEAINELEGVKSRMADDVRRSVAQQVDIAVAALRDELARARRTAEAASQTAQSAQDMAEEQLKVARDELQRASDRAAAAQQQHEAEVASLTQQLGAMQDELERVEREAAKNLQDLDDLWRSRMTEAIEQWQRSTGVERLNALESQIAFLTRRIAELATVCDAQQAALAGVASTGPANAPSGRAIGISSGISSGSGSSARAREVAVLRHAAVDHLGHDATAALAALASRSSTRNPIPTETRYVMAS